MKTKYKYDKNEFFNDTSFEDYTDNNNVLSQTATKSYVDQISMEYEINYTEYIIEQLNTCINYSEYINEKLNTNISYSEYN